MSILQGYTEATSILNELFGIGKKKKKEVPPFPRDEYTRIVAKYKNKNIIPKWGSIDVAAYKFCKYTKEDIVKFCNAKDTNMFKKMIEESIHMVNDNPDIYNDNELKMLESILKQITSNSIVELTQKGSYSHPDGMIFYSKNLKAFYFPNNDETIPYEDKSMDRFADSVYDEIYYTHGYNIDNVENEEE